MCSVKPLNFTFLIIAVLQKSSTSLNLKDVSTNLIIVSCVNDQLSGQHGLCALSSL